MSAKADKGDVGTVSAEEEDDEALKVSAMMGKLSAAQLKEFAPKLADAQSAVAKEDRRLLALKLKLELACKDKTKADPPKPTVNVSTVVPSWSSTSQAGHTLHLSKSGSYRQSWT